jgi:hypothetical protein
MYFLSPRNRYLLVEEEHVTVTKQEEKGYLLPMNYREREQPYKIVRVIEDANAKYEPESLILVPTNVLEEVEINKQKFYLVTDNYILATVTKTED